MQITDKSYRNRYKILRGGVINNFHLENPTRQLQGQNTPASIITLINNSKASGSCCPIPTPIESTPIIPIPVVINLAETTLVYSTDQGSEVNWDETIFTKNTDLSNFSYSATIIFLPVSTIPVPSNLISIRIGNSVTSIGALAFQNCTSLTSIIIPNSVISIGDRAFRQCTSLTSIIIPNSVTSIGIGAFQNCTSLTSIIIPNSVTSIGSSAFQNCTSLTSIIIPNSVTRIGSSVFRECTSLISIIIPNSLIIIGSTAFINCTSLTSIIIPNSVRSIDFMAFLNSGLANVYISSATAIILGVTSPATGVYFFGRTVTTYLPL